MNVSFDNGRDMMKNRPMIHLHSNLDRPKCAANSLLIEETRALPER